MSSRTSAILKHAAPPLLALVVLLVLPRVLANRANDPVAIERRHAEVLRAVESLPWRFDGWWSESHEVPAIAYRILRPNAVLSRRYHSMDGGPWVDFIVVHCSDARDMEGHYPTACYPANGWVRNSNETSSLGFDAPMPVQRYHFSRIEDWGTNRSIWVFNYFILPNGNRTSDHRIVRHLARSYATSVRGVAQVQFVTAGDVPVEQARERVETLLRHTQPLLDVIAHGDTDDHAPAS